MLPVYTVSILMALKAFGIFLCLCFATFCVLGLNARRPTEQEKADWDVAHKEILRKSHH